MDPQQFSNAIEKYIENLETAEIQNLLQFHNDLQDENLYIPDGEDEVDLVDGR